MFPMVEVMITAILLGLMGSFHCLGMCGPLVFSLSLPGQKSQKKVWELLTALYYNCMRIISYGVIGVLVGIVGETLQIVVAQRFLSIFFGGIMIIWALFKMVKMKKLKINLFLLRRWTGWLDALIDKGLVHFGHLIRKFRRDNLIHLGLLGFFHGWLPCGLVYMAAAAALVYGRVEISVVFMFFFGIGTFPIMIASFLSFHRINQSFRRRIQEWIPVFLMLLGFLFVLRGMNLGIPLISPNLENMLSSLR